jgi:transposase
MKKEYLSQTEIGKIYGVSSHVVGKWLKSLELRDQTGQPTNRAKSIHKLCTQRQSTNEGTWIYVWDKTQILSLLDQMGQQRAG